MIQIIGYGRIEKGSKLQNCKKNEQMKVVSLNLWVSNRLIAKNNS